MTRLKQRIFHPAIAVTMLSAAMCFMNLRIGISQSFYPDEAFFDMYALRIIDYFSGNPISYQLDPPVFSLCLAVLYGCYYIFGLAAGIFHNTQDLLVSFATQREHFTLIGRTLSASFAVASVPLLYHVTKKLFDARTALLSICLFAFSYPMIWHAHIMHHTTLSVFISLLICLCALRVRENASWKNYLICGITIGAGIGVKIYPGLFALSLVVVHFQRNPFWKKDIHLRDFSKLLAGAGAAIVAACIAFPWPVLEYAQWSASLAHTGAFFERGSLWLNFYYLFWGRSVYYSSVTAEPFSYWSNSLRVLTESGILLFGAGFIYTWIRYPSRALIFLTPFAIFLVHHVVRGGLGMGSRQFYFLLPFMYICSAVLLNKLISMITGSRIKFAYPIVFMLLAAAFYQPVTWALKYLWLTGRPTTTEIAKAWMKDNLPQGSTLLLNYAAPYSNISSWYKEDQEQHLSPALLKARRKMLPPYAIIQLSEYDHEKEIAPYRKKKNTYVILTDYNSTEYYKYENCRLWGEHKYYKFPQKTAYFNYIYRNSEIMHTVSSKEAGALGPTIHIYHLN